MDTAAPQCPQQVVKSVEKKASRPAKEHALNCPRCSSTNTKFCYYNNYSLSQPRYFCKACRRYWTEGGCLRNVPVGGGSRKNRRPSSSSAPILSSIDKSIVPSHGGQDLSLAYDHPNNNIGMSEYIALPFDPQNPNFENSLPLPVMEFFKPVNIYNDNNNTSSSAGFPVMHDFKAGLGFPAGEYYGNLHDDRANDDSSNNNNSSRNIGFPFGEMKQQDQQIIEQGDQPRGFWNGMLAGGSSW